MEVFHVIKITTAESSSDVGLFLTQQPMLCFSPEFLARANKIMMMATSVASESGLVFSAGSSYYFLCVSFLQVVGPRTQ